MRSGDFRGEGSVERGQGSTDLHWGVLGGGWNDGVLGYWNDGVFTVSQRLRNIGHSAGAERQSDL